MSTNSRQLIAAAARGDAAAVRNILRRAPRLAAAARDPDGNTPLIWAAFGGTPAHAEVVRLLLPGCGDPDYAPKGGMTALASAAWRGAADAVDLLLADRRVDPNKRNRFGRPAGYYAVVTGRTDIVGKLLALPAPADFSLGTGTDANVDHMRRMCIDDNTVSFLESRLAELGLDVEPWWRDTGDADPATDPSAALRRACLGWEWDLAGVRRALDDGADPNGRSARGITPLMCAAWMWRVDALELLLSLPGIDLLARDDLGRTAYYYAMASNGLDAAYVLLQRAPELAGISDFAGRKPLHANVEEMNRSEGRNPWIVPGKGGKKRAAGDLEEPAPKRAAFEAVAADLGDGPARMEPGPDRTTDSQPCDPDLLPAFIKPEPDPEPGSTPAPTWSQVDDLSGQLATETRLRHEAEDRLRAALAREAELELKLERMRGAFENVVSRNRALWARNVELRRQQ
ncbi:ankyrin repeat-containing domain protein [Hyaloraphidium curvatum]|nr:ankyrin repeat-containing domain protein [Hyaloraphidium curvatum]